MKSDNNIIEDYNETWADLANFCIYWGGSMKKIPNIQEFFDKNDSVSAENKFYVDTYYVILRTSYLYEGLVAILYSLFSKLFSMEVIELSWDEIKFQNSSRNKSTDDLMAFAIKFDVIRPNLWNSFSLSKMVFYSLSLLELLDYKYCPNTIQQSYTTLGDIFYDLLHSGNSSISYHRTEFFHQGLAELFIILRNLQARNESHVWRFLRDGPRFISDDAAGITFVLQSRHDISEAVSRVDGYNSTQITDEILKQYETMRRNF